MPAVTSRATLKEYCLRKLGSPVTEINVDPEQIEDRIDDAIQYIQEFSSDGQLKVFARHKLTQTDIDNEFITVGDDVLQVIRVLPVPLSTSSDILFDVEYQIRLEEIWNLRNAGQSIIGYMMTMQHLEFLNEIFNRHEQIAFERHQSRLHIFLDWSEMLPDKHIVMEVMRIVDPATAPKMYNDRLLKAYATTLIMEQWGQNIAKFDGVVLLGGVTMNGSQIQDKAFALREQQEEEIRLVLEDPVDFFFG